MYETESGTESIGSLSSIHSLTQSLSSGKRNQAYSSEELLSIQQLKDMPIWLCWNKRVKQKGRATKVPISPFGTTTGTDKAHRRSWTTYAVACAAANKQGWDGVGFVIPEGIAFLDLDGMSPEDPFVQTLMTLLPSYAERSVSGTGMHIYMRCNLSRLPIVVNERGERSLSGYYYIKNPHSHIEFYIGGLTNRYAVFTGDTVADLPLNDCTDGILTFLDSYMLREKKPELQEKKPEVRTLTTDEVPHDPGELGLEAMETVQGLRRQGNAEKFCKLYDRGNFTDYQSQSEADLALCSMIAYRTGDRPDLIDAVFRSSALCRDKWDREDYRTNTIQKAIKLHKGIFHPDSGQLPPFIVLGRNRTPSVHPTRLAQYIREHTNYLLVRDSGRDMLDFYVYEDGVYRCYDSDMVKSLIKAPIEAFDYTLVNSRVLNEVYNQLTIDRNYIKPDLLNSEERYINFQNGLLEVTADSLTLYPHRPDVLSTVRIPGNWPDKEKPTPVFDRYLDTLTGGDRSVAELLLQFMGVCLSNVRGYRMKKALILVGPGNTGKSQLKSLMERLLGKENYISIDLRGIEARFGTAMLYGKRLAGSADMSYLSIAELKNFKQLTGGDSIFAEYKGKQGFSFCYQGVLWFCANRLPRFGGDDGDWVYERFLTVPCMHVIPEKEQDKQLLEKLCAERDGILYRLVHALQTVIRNGYRYTEPACVAASRRVFREENNSVIRFITECLESRRYTGKTDQCFTTSAVYRVYRKWCEDNEHGYVRTQKEFRDIISDFTGIPYDEMTVHTNLGTVYRTVALKEDTIRQYGLGSEFV